MRRLGIAWKVEIDVFTVELEDGSKTEIHYLPPQKILQFLVEHHPRLVCGEETWEKGMESFKAFWEGYSCYHPTHAVYAHHTDLARVIPVALHGDEGKGKRRSNTTLLSFESVLGFVKKFQPCSTCCPTFLKEPVHKCPRVANPMIKSLFTNMKGHSYLQHWPIIVIPGTFAENYRGIKEQFMQHLATQFESLFHHGFVAHGHQWHCAVVGLKADLKFHSFAARLTRGYENKGRVVDKECCHCCLAGQAGLPAEDVGHEPVWLSSLYCQRPWNANALPYLHDIPFDSSRPEAMYKHDCFHTLRLGLFRDIIGSVIFLWIHFDYYGNRGKIDIKLNNVFSQFKMFLTTQKMKASLRSFTKSFFAYKNKRSFPWANCKGSDATVLLKFIAAMTVAYLNTETCPERREVHSVILSMSRVGLEVFNHMYQHTMFMDWNCGAVLYEKGMSLLSGYGWLANWTFQRSLCLFGIKPKSHFWRHVLQEVKTQLNQNSMYVLNPALFDCQQNEDIIGRICGLAVKTDSRVQSYRVLEFYLFKAARLCDRHLGSN